MQVFTQSLFKNALIAPSFVKSVLMESDILGSQWLAAVNSEVLKPASSIPNFCYYIFHF